MHRELAPGVIANVSPTTSPETIAALKEMARLAARQRKSPMSDFDKSQAVRRHTACRGKNVTTRWQFVAQDLFAENVKLRAENERRKKRMQWYENRLADYAGNA